MVITWCEEPCSIKIHQLHPCEAAIYMLGDFVSLLCPYQDPTSKYTLYTKLICDPIFRKMINLW